MISISQKISHKLGYKNGGLKWDSKLDMPIILRIQSIIQLNN
jgi:hypothetical protein